MKTKIEETEEKIHIPVVKENKEMKIENTKEFENNHYKVLLNNETEIKVHQPDNDDMKKINRFAKKTLSKDEIAVYTFKLANDKIDRTNEKFTVSALNKLKNTIVEKAFLEMHNNTKMPIGLVFDAWVEKNLNVNWLMVKVFLLNEPENRFMIKNIDAGIFRYVSIGFKGRPQEIEEDGKTFWQYNEKDIEESLEASIVWLGAQIGAGVKSEVEDYIEKCNKELSCKKVCTDCKNKQINIEIDDNKRIKELKDMGIFTSEDMINYINKMNELRIEDNIQKEGRVISRKNVNKINDAIIALESAKKALNEVLQINEDLNGEGTNDNEDEKSINIDEVLKKLKEVGRIITNK